KRTDGRYVRMGGEKIGAEMGVPIGTVTGCAKTIRDNIRTRLKRELNIECQDNDVLVNDDQGYHLHDDKVSVRTANDALQSGQEHHEDAGGSEHERLNWILAKVKNGGEVTQQQIQDRFGVS